MRLTSERAFRLGVGGNIRRLRKKKRLPQKTLAEMVGISAGAVTNFEKGRRRISLDWLRRIADALDSPIAYFLVDDRGKGEIVPGDPREKRLVEAWRLLGNNPSVQTDFLRIMEDLGRLGCPSSLLIRMGFEAHRRGSYQPNRGWL